MKHFDLSRFWLTLKADNVLQWKTALKLTLSMAFGLMIIYTVSFMQMDSPSYAAIVNNQLSNCSGITAFVLFMFMGVGGCYMTNNMRTKQHRIAFLSLPASNSEKFLSRYLWCTVGFLLMYIGAAVIADVLRMLLCLIVYGDMCGSVLAYMIGELAEFDLAANGEPIWSFVFLLIASLLYGHSNYMLGGVIFRRFNWILTTVVLYLLSFLLLPLLGLLEFYESDVDAFIDKSGPVALCVGLGVVCLLLTSFNYWLSYKVFCRMQVICNKLINI